MKTIKPLPPVNAHDHPSNDIGISWGLTEVQWIKNRDAQWKALLDKALADKTSTVENTDWEKACAQVFEMNTKSGHMPGYAVQGSDTDLRYFYTGDWINAAFMTQERVTIDSTVYMVAHATNAIKGCFVPLGTHIGHLRDCNGLKPFMDYSQKWGGLFNGAPNASSQWKCFEEGAMLFTSDGKEELEPGTHYRVLEKTDGKSGVLLMVRKAKFPYPDRDVFVSMIEA
jgi:hypothetical protein